MSWRVSRDWFVSRIHARRLCINRVTHIAVEAAGRDSWAVSRRGIVPVEETPKAGR